MIRRHGIASADQMNGLAMTEPPCYTNVVIFFLMKLSSTNLLFAAAGLVVVGLIVYAILAPAAPSKYDSFAACLSEKDVKMYGAWWCPHCANQKKLFGSSFDEVKYIECSPGGPRIMSVQCREAGITGYPTWEFADGIRLNGEQSLATLAQKSGCTLPE